MNPDHLLPLDLRERAVSWINEEGKRRLHVFRRITGELCNGYFARCLFESDATSRTIDLKSPVLWFYANAIERVEGYPVKGGVDLCSLPNWKDKVLVGHRLKAVNLLTAVERSVEATEEIEPDCEAVRLDATWGAADGQMRRYYGLVHRLSTATVEQMMRFSRETNKSIIVGGSRNGRTIHVIRQKVLVKFYDELVISVEGYSVDGRPLEGRDEIAREMDAFHKIAAVAQLFDSGEEEEKSDGASDGN